MRATLQAHVHHAYQTVALSPGGQKMPGWFGPVVIVAAVIGLVVIATLFLRRSRR